MGQAQASEGSVMTSPRRRLSGAGDDAGVLAIIAASSATVAALLAWIAAWAFEAPGIASWVVAVAATCAAGFGIAALKAVYALVGDARLRRRGRRRQ